MGLFNNKKEISKLEKRIDELSNIVHKIQIQLFLKDYKHIVDLLVENQLNIVFNKFFKINNFWDDSYYISIRALDDYQFTKKYDEVFWDDLMTEYDEISTLIINFLNENKITELEFVKCVLYIRLNADKYYKPGVDYDTKKIIEKLKQQ